MEKDDGGGGSDGGCGCMVYNGKVPSNGEWAANVLVVFLPAFFILVYRRMFGKAL